MLKIKYNAMKSYLLQYFHRRQNVGQ